MTRRTTSLRSRTLLLAVVASTALAACSSTNAKKAESLADGAQPTTSAAPVVIGTNGKPLTKAQIIAAVKAGKLPASALKQFSAAPTSTGSRAPDRRTTTSTTGTRAATSKWTGAIGPGVTATTIKIGISTFKLGDFAKNLGVNVDVGDPEKQAYAVINYLNARGGIAGRKIVPSFFQVDFSKAGSGGGVDGQLEAAACEQWTGDDKVFAAVNLALQRQQLLACLAKKDVLGVHNGLQIDEARMSPYRRWYYTTIGGSAVIQDRAAHTEDKILCSKGWFKGATVGIIYYDEQPMRDIVDKIYEPEILKCGGKKVVKQAAGRGLTTPDSTFVATFQAAGVTNVMFLGEGGSYPYTFMPAAENQQYRPKYALRSDMAPSIQLAAAQVPPEQLQNSIGYGIVPVQDTGDVAPTNSADALCESIFKKASIPTSDKGARLATENVCSSLFFLKQAMDKSTGVNSAAFAKGVAALGTAFIPPGTFACRFSSTQHDCESVYREFAYRYADKAFYYTSGKKPMNIS